MWQLIITICIVLLALVAAIFFAWRHVRRLRQPDPCRDCKASCGDCALHQELQRTKKKPGRRR